MPDPETGGQQSYVPGPEEEHYYSSNVIDPAVMLEAPLILSPATVRLNGADIGSLEMTPDYSLQRIPYDPELLLPFPALNRIQILATVPLAPVGLVGFPTGPVHSGELMAGVPGAPSAVIALVALALLLGGLLVFATAPGGRSQVRRRRRRAAVYEPSS